MASAVIITYIILFFLLITIWLVLRFRKDVEDKNTDMTYVKSDIDGDTYLVRNLSDKKKAANLLASLKSDLMHVIDYLNEKYKSDKNNKEYITQLTRNIKNVFIRESDPDTKYTSYTINKGETIVFCIRPKTLSKYTTTGDIHDKNLIMYVALHEISHVACPEYGHTKLFKEIFKLITEAAIERGVYKKIDFNRSPVEYCGMQITDSIV